MDAGLHNTSLVGLGPACQKRNRNEREPEKTGGKRRPV